MGSGEERFDERASRELVEAYLETDMLPPEVAAVVDDDPTVALDLLLYCRGKRRRPSREHQ